MKKSMASILLFIFLLTCSSCHKVTNADKVPLMPKLSIGNEAEYVVENPPTKPPSTNQVKKSFLTVDYFENSGPIRKSRTLIPIQLKDSVFEYLSAPYLIRFDIQGHQKSEFKDPFKNAAWTNRNDEVLFGEKENWVIGDDTNYYYLESNYQQKKGNEYEDYKTSYTLVCKKRDTFKIVWQTKIIDEDNAFAQRIIQNEKSIFVFTRSNLSMTCVDKQTGQISWKFEAGKEIPCLSLPNTYHNNNSVLGLSKVRLIHQFSNYLVLRIYSYDTRSKTENPYMFTENIEKYFIVSLDGKIIREIPDVVPYTYEKPSPFHDDLYFYQNDKEFGMKGIFDSQIRWKQKTVTVDPETEVKEVTRNETDQKEVFYLLDSNFILRIMIRNGEKIQSTISLLNYKDGKTVWTKTLQMKVYQIQEHQGIIYMIGSEEEYNTDRSVPTYLSILQINPNNPKETIFPIDLAAGDWDIEKNIYSEFEVVTIKEIILLFSRNGFVEIDKGRAYFFDYPSVIDPVLRDYWTIPDYWNVTVKTYQEKVLVVFTNDSEDSGGGYIVFSLLKQEK